MLTIVKDCAAKARDDVDAEVPLDDMLSNVVREAFASVARTPDLLDVLKENDVVDAGAYGLAILAEGMLASYRGEALDIADIPTTAAPALTSAPSEDWDDDEYLYCTEFLVHGDSLDKGALEEYVSGMGGSELIVGDDETLKIHVHTDNPADVLAHMLEHGELSEVHVNNMRRQTVARGTALREEAADDSLPPYGIVTVAAGEGVREIFASLGVDLVVNGGQTMNPSTAEILKACEGIGAQSILILPNNKNIHLSAQQAAEVCPRPAGVVPTRSVPEAFSALLAFDPEGSLDDNLEAMADAASDVATGEVTTAVRDSKGKAGDILAGQVIGIADSEIEFVGDDIMTVAKDLAAFLLKDADTLTLLAGEDLDDAALGELVSSLEASNPDIEVEAHRGGQPLYPLVLAAE
jgi:DAK2 domain fusion protein YloV